MRRFRLAVLVLLLSACGGREALKPQAGESLPPKPAFAEAPPTAAELIAPSTQSRPERSDELLRRSEERADDRFDLPPQE